MLASRLPADGVGLVRMEFLLSNVIRVHPLALFRYPKYVDELTADAISNILEANGYDSSAPDVGETFFQNTVCEGIATMAAAFHPRPVVIRLSDFKSNEYRGLIGGVAVEDEEENPMLGLYVLRATHYTPALTRNHTLTNTDCHAEPFVALSHHGHPKPRRRPLPLQSLRRVHVHGG
jgi:pyruvate,water dikinase